MSLLLKNYKKILVIKHGALGDLINAMGAFEAIRHNHRQAHIILLTSPAYINLMTETGYFDEIVGDARSRNPLTTWKLRSRLLKLNVERVYDLQNSDRTALYFKLLGPGKRPEWSGVATGCSHPQMRKDHKQLHAFVRFAKQLKIAGLDLKGQDELFPDLSWLKKDVNHLNLPENAVLLVPGSSLRGAYKRWPAEKYAELALWLKNEGFNPVLLGGPDDIEVVNRIIKIFPTIHNLSQKINFFEIGALACKALAIIGNDTGAIHLAAAMKCPTLILWPHPLAPELYAPRGKHVKVLRLPNLSDSNLKEVQEAVREILMHN
ncbi:hypothetical protein IM40_03295 [Candidatus Paracaedimonas acanthamoebae]|nr:hypothetical protein IM40_03295 [Candidatus Paracaedimonas acanthamoebae]